MRISIYTSGYGRQKKPVVHVEGGLFDKPSDVAEAYMEATNKLEGERPRRKRRSKKDAN